MSDENNTDANNITKNSSNVDMIFNEKSAEFDVEDIKETTMQRHNSSNSEASGFENRVKKNNVLINTLTTENTNMS